jgi:FkbM family methyltransferase
MRGELRGRPGRGIPPLKDADGCGLNTALRLLIMPHNPGDVMNSRHVARSLLARVLPHALLSRSPQVRATKVMAELIRRSRTADGAVTFVNVGACDGLRFDDITPLIRRMTHVKALLVEPVPHNIQRLRRNFPDASKFAIEECAIAAEAGSITMTTFSPEAITSGQLPIEFVGASSTTQNNIMGGRTSWGVTDPKFADYKPYLLEITVPALPLQAVLDKHGLKRIDVIVIDAEGADWSILKQLDLERYRPALIKLEIGCLPPEDIGAAVIALKRQDYDLALSGDDLWAFAGRTGGGQDGRLDK